MRSEISSHYVSVALGVLVVAAAILGGNTVANINGDGLIFGALLVLALALPTIDPSRIGPIPVAFGCRAFLSIATQLAPLDVWGAAPRGPGQFPTLGFIETARALLAFLVALSVFLVTLTLRCPAARSLLPFMVVALYCNLLAGMVQFASRQPIGENVFGYPLGGGFFINQNHFFDVPPDLHPVSDVQPVPRGSQVVRARQPVPASAGTPCRQFHGWRRPRACRDARLGTRSDGAAASVGLCRAGRARSPRDLPDRVPEPVRAGNRGAARHTPADRDDHPRRHPQPFLDWHRLRNIRRCLRNVHEARRRSAALHQPCPQRLSRTHLRGWRRGAGTDRGLPHAGRARPSSPRKIRSSDALRSPSGSSLRIRSWTIRSAILRCCSCSRF